MPKDALGHGSNPRGAMAAHMTGIHNATRIPHISPAALAHIQSHPGGFSVNAKGHAPSTGYMVAAPGRSRIVSEAELKGPGGQKILQDYARDNSDALRQPGAHIGGWTDHASGKTYLDISHRVGARWKAIETGRKRNQIAIWDMKHGREISTGGTGE